MELYSFIGVGLGRELSVFEIFDLARFPIVPSFPHYPQGGVGLRLRVQSLGCMVEESRRRHEPPVVARKVGVLLKRGGVQD